MNQTKIYTAPSADVVLMVPCEQIAAKDWKFGSTWHDGYFTFGTAPNTASGVGIQDDFTYTEGADGYTIIRGKTQ